MVFIGFDARREIKLRFYTPNPLGPNAGTGLDLVQSSGPLKALALLHEIVRNSKALVYVVVHRKEYVENSFEVP